MIPAWRTLWPAEEALFRGSFKEILEKLTDRCVYLLLYAIYCQESTAPCLRYVRPRGVVVDFAPLLAVNKCEEGDCTHDGESLASGRETKDYWTWSRKQIGGEYT